MENNLINIWASGPITRFRTWKNLRSDLESSNFDKAFHDAYRWWTSAPSVRRTFDPWKLEQWPNPWELLYKEDFCPNSIALGIWYMLKLTNQDLSRVQLCVVSDREQKHNCLALVLDNKTVYLYNKKLSIESPMVEILNTFSEDEVESKI